MRKLPSLQGERWDQLCYRVYGASTESGVLALREANPVLLSDGDPFVLPAGYLLTIPDIALDTTEAVEVAPWQR